MSRKDSNMSRKDYVLIARRLSQLRHAHGIGAPALTTLANLSPIEQEVATVVFHRTVDRLADAFHEINPRFDAERFHDAVMEDS